jgi:hypothetical protein
MGRFQQIRAEIRAGRCRGQAFRKLIAEELRLDQGIMGYDELDVFVNRLLNIGEMPAPATELAAEMVEFYKTPARVVVELVERMGFGPEDIFVDLGAGLGQVVLLVHLLTGMRALGVEIEPAYCAYARRCAEKLGLTGVGFELGDARGADLSAGTVFFLFTPFKGDVFSQVMERVKVLALARRIRVVGYGPCSDEIARLDWLRREGGVCADGGVGADRGGEAGRGEGGEYMLQVFNSYREGWEGGVPFGGPISNYAH